MTTRPREPAPPRARRSTGAKLVALLVAAPFVLAGLYLSAVMGMAFVMSVTGVGMPERALLFVPLPALVGLGIGVLVYRVASRPPRPPDDAR
jgi:energy-coupling factor transporter transmembrane protein EcfT